MNVAKALEDGSLDEDPFLQHYRAHRREELKKQASAGVNRSVDGKGVWQYVVSGRRSISQWINGWGAKLSCTLPRNKIMECRSDADNHVKGFMCVVTFYQRLVSKCM